MAPPDWSTIASLAAAVSAVVGLPLTVIIFYLRAMREDQRAFVAEWQRRAERLESDNRRLGSALHTLARTSTPRREWRREQAAIRRELGRLAGVLACLRSEGIESSRSAGRRAGRGRSVRV